MKDKKSYLGFFYGNKQELTKAFTKITDGDYVRYVLTAETLICRFKSNKPVSDINEILKSYCSDIPFFIFPISNKNNWCFNLPIDIENNLLTDNPIIQNQQNNIINQHFISMMDEIKKQMPMIIDERTNDFFDKAIEKLEGRRNQAVLEENYELATQIRNKIKELKEQRKELNDEYSTTT